MKIIRQMTLVFALLTVPPSLHAAYVSSLLASGMMIDASSQTVRGTVSIAFSAIAILLASSASPQVTTSTTTTQNTSASPANPVRDARALAVLSQCAVTMGSVGPADSYLATGQIEYADGQTPPADVVIKGLGADRVRRELSGGQSVWIVNRGRGSASVNGRPHKLPDSHTKYFRPEHNPAALCSLDAARAMMHVAYVGVESVNSKPAHHIRFFATSQDPNENVISDFHLFVDAQSFLVVQTKTFAFSSEAIENRSDWETYYSDYRRVGTVLLPFRIDNSLRGQRLLTLTFTSVRNDVPASDKDFR